jgi:hypothetical protein
LISRPLKYAGSTLTARAGGNAPPTQAPAGALLLRKLLEEEKVPTG